MFLLALCAPAQPRAKVLGMPTHRIHICDRGRHVGMPEQLLHGANVVVGLQQVDGKTMPQRMTAHTLVDATSGGSTLHRFLNRVLVEVVAANSPAIGVEGQTTRGKEEMPLELAPGIGVLARKRIGQHDLAIAGRDVRGMKRLDISDLLS